MGLPKVTDLPRVAKIRQLLPHEKVDDREGVVRAELGKLRLENRIEKGWRVGITVGSRGAGGTVDTLKGAITHVRSVGGEPFYYLGNGQSWRRNSQSRYQSRRFAVGGLFTIMGCSILPGIGCDTSSSRPAPGPITCPNYAARRWCMDTATRRLLWE